MQKSTAENPIAQESNPDTYLLFTPTPARMLAQYCDCSANVMSTTRECETMRLYVTNWMNANVPIRGSRFEPLL